MAQKQRFIIPRVDSNALFYQVIVFLKEIAVFLRILNFSLGA